MGYHLPERENLKLPPGARARVNAPGYSRGFVGSSLR
jgi:hypothetical protein